MKWRILRVNLNDQTWEIEEYPLPEFFGWADIGIYYHLEVFETWKAPPLSPQNILYLGTGPFAGSKLLGSHRMGFVFKSPLSRTLHFSEMGGIGYTFIKAGLNGLVITEKAEKPVILTVLGGDKKLQVKFSQVSEKKLSKVYEGYKSQKGVYALSLWLFHEFEGIFKDFNARSMVVGPGSWTTLAGAVASIEIDKVKEVPVYGTEDFAGRGGAGSVMAQAHNLAAIIVGGNRKKEFPSEIFTNTKILSEFFKDHLGEPYPALIKHYTKKYRFDEKIGAGGTFGCNYPQYREWLPTFGYNSIYLKKEWRKKIYAIIEKNFWRPFKKEVFEKKKSWRTCGEPCPVACKKVYFDRKVDYEPFHSIGPLIGVMDIEAARKLCYLVDSLGLDAIEIGHIISWIFDCLDKGLFLPEEIGLKDYPTFNPFALNPEKWNKNAELAEKIIENLVKKTSSPLSLIAEKGIRKAAKELSQKFTDRVERSGCSFEDLVLYQPYGEDGGYMTPNLYWTMGFLLPVFITGKYWTEYSMIFVEPEDMAELVFERAMQELSISNSGFCRFHRKYLECVIEDLYAFLGITDLYERCQKLYGKIMYYSIKSLAVPKPVESKKAIDLFYSLAEEYKDTKWLEKFERDKNGAYFEWYRRFIMKFFDYFKVSQSEKGK